jgi:probable F420-dependent oxidoreductase
MRRFRFGVNMWKGGSRAEWMDKARQLEDLGYGVLTVPDHLADFLAPVPALTAAALATRHLRVGTLVLNNDLRHPALVAREAATLDLLSDGRLELGVGAGHMKTEYDQAGLSFGSGATRVERLAEAVSILKALLAGESVTVSGRHYRVTGHKVHPLPVQLPHPPILIGGNGPRLLALAGREANIIALSGITFRQGGTRPDLSAWKTAAVEERLAIVRAAAGERHPHLELNALVQRVIVTSDRHGAARDLAVRWPQLSVEELLESPFLLVGTVDEMVEDLRARRERWGISYYTVPEPFMSAFAPIVNRLAGT